MTLFDDPVAWAEGTVGKRAVFAFVITVQVLLGFAAIWITRKHDIDGGMTFGIMFFGIAVPCMYLVALRGVLREYNKCRDKLSGTAAE